MISGSGRISISREKMVRVLTNQKCFKRTVLGLSSSVLFFGTLKFSDSDVPSKSEVVWCSLLPLTSSYEMDRMPPCCWFSAGHRTLQWHTLCHPTQPFCASTAQYSDTQSVSICWWRRCISRHHAVFLCHLQCTWHHDTCKYDTVACISSKSSICLNFNKACS